MSKIEMRLVIRGEFRKYCAKKLLHKVISQFQGVMSVMTNEQIKSFFDHTKPILVETMINGLSLHHCSPDILGIVDDFISGRSISRIKFICRKFNEKLRYIF